MFSLGKSEDDRIDDIFNAVKHRTEEEACELLDRLPQEMHKSLLSSRGGSRAGSRGGSRAGSREGSRNSSPDSRSLLSSRNNSETSLMWMAAYAGKVKVMAKLRRLSSASGTRARDAIFGDPDEDGVSPFHIAASRGEVKALKFLVENGVDINAPDNNGNTAVHHAAANNRSECLDILCAHGADLKLKNKLSETPLDLAKKNGYVEVVDMLKRGQASFFHPASVSLCSNAIFFFHPPPSSVSSGRKQCADR